MAKLKKGEFLTCRACGLVVVVDAACNCAVGEIICCEDKPMVKGKAAAMKAKKKPAAKAAAKPAAKAAKKSSKAKPMAKKPAAKKPLAKAKKK